jgi:hypothetical protein
MAGIVTWRMKMPRRVRPQQGSFMVSVAGVGGRRRFGVYPDRGPVQMNSVAEATGSAGDASRGVRGELNFRPVNCVSFGFQKAKLPR